MAARIPSHIWDFSQKKPVERALFFLLGSPKIFNFWGERRHWVLSTRQASSVRFNCRTRSWPTWNRTKIFRTKIWRNSLYTIGHRQNKLRELTCCASGALRLFFLLNQNAFWFSFEVVFILSFRKRVQRYCFFLNWPNYLLVFFKKMQFSLQNAISVA